jgi:acetamidase/formamidase
VRILDVQVRQDWGHTRIHPLSGSLPVDFPALDAARMVGRLPGAVSCPQALLRRDGGAPPAAWGRLSSVQPRAHGGNLDNPHGGNLDNKELVAGTKRYLPVWCEVALFSAGDGHAVQGDGEVCITAIESALTDTFEFHVRRDLNLRFPQAETATDHITMAANPDLDDAAKDALRDYDCFGSVPHQPRCGRCIHAVQLGCGCPGQAAGQWSVVLPKWALG